MATRSIEVSNTCQRHLKSKTGQVIWKKKRGLVLRGEKRRTALDAKRGTT